MSDQIMKDTAPDLTPERRQRVRLEMVRFFGTDGDAWRKPISYRSYLLATTSVFALVRGQAHGTA